ncbi:MAG: hypothetical protein IPM92_12610 [Saprospiraceae bacterium]|nr:hypothetical protein [Saprospiraceae bacterium]
MASNFHSWPYQSKQSWIDQVLKDNPRTNKSDYTFQLEEAIISDPFPFFTDLSPDTNLNINSIVPSNWKCGTLIFLDDLNQSAIELQNALSNGIEYIPITILHNYNTLQLEKIFDNIHLDFIQITWLFPDYYENYKKTFDFILKIQTANIAYCVIPEIVLHRMDLILYNFQFIIYQLSQYRIAC